MAIYHLIRHGEPDWQMIRRRNLHPCRNDFVPLTNAGVSEAEEVSHSPNISASECIISSPYTRALQTAAVIAKNLSLPLHIEYDLHERLPDTTFTVTDFQTLLALCSDWETHGGDPAGVPDHLWESLPSIRGRITGVLEHYHNFGEVIVVFHELAIRSVVGFHDRIPHCGIRTITDKDLPLY